MTLKNPHGMHMKRTGRIAFDSSEFSSLTERLEFVCSALEALQKSRTSMYDANYNSKHKMQAFDQVYDDLIKQLQGLAWRATEIKASKIEELAAKAKIWLERYVPDADDDVNCLSASICADIIALNAKAKRGQHLAIPADPIQTAVKKFPLTKKVFWSMPLDRTFAPGTS